MRDTLTSIIRSVHTNTRKPEKIDEGTKKEVIQRKHDKNVSRRKEKDEERLNGEIKVGRGRGRFIMK